MDIEINKRLFNRFRRRARKDLATGANLATNEISGNTTIQVIALNKDQFLEKSIQRLDELNFYLEKYQVVWIQVIGLSEISKLEEIAQYFSIHKLALEDIINLSQRPKIEEYDDFMLAITRMPTTLNDELDLEQISLIWGKNFIISFMANNNLEQLTPLTGRLKSDLKRPQMLKAEYIAYAIIDIIIDSFFPLLETYGQKLDDIEDDAITDPSAHIIFNIHNYKHDLLIIRRAMWSQREALRKLVEVTKFDDKDLRFFMRDCEDHTMQIIDILESYRERTGSLVDIYLSSVNNKMNEVMKVLTMISTIFMPTGVIASIYGMNFDRTSAWNLPELGWKYGYEYALALMFILAIIFMFYFKRKGWIFNKDKNHLSIRQSTRKTQK